MITKTCTISGKQFVVSDEDLEWYQKFDVPIPDECPHERMLHRLTGRNTRNLYARKCDGTGDRFLSQYDDDVPFPVYQRDYWWSDDWDARNFWAEYDFDRSFFDQFFALSDRVPHVGSYVIQPENSTYTNCTGFLKNCYLVFEGRYSEDCYYSNGVRYNKDVVDCSFCQESELLYECIGITKSYNLTFSESCDNCVDSAFLRNCIGCRNCVGCVNLRHKEFCIFNQQFSPQQYEIEQAKLGLDSYAGVTNMRVRFDDFVSTKPCRWMEGLQNENVIGDYIYYSKNAYHCFDALHVEDCRYCSNVTIGPIKNCMDFNSWGENAELVYMSAGCGENLFNIKFCLTCTQNIKDCEYCEECVKCENCFGCVGLRNAQYCILNKQYTREEYVDLKSRIVAHMKAIGEYGKFFPRGRMPFCYNQGIGMDYFQLKKEEAVTRGFRWKEEKEKTEDRKQKTDFFDTIDEVNDDALDAVFVCEETGKSYRIIRQELDFYRQMNLPLPRFCPDERHRQRMTRRNKRILNTRSCSECGVEIQTARSEDNVLCEKCYLGEIS